MYKKTMQCTTTVTIDFWEKKSRGKTNVMSAINYIRAMASYNQWINKRIYALCSALSDQERKRDVGAFFKSIYGTLHHLLLADRIWMGRFTERSCVFKSLDQELYSDFMQLRSERERDDIGIIPWAAVLRDKDLTATFLTRAW